MIQVVARVYSHEATSWFMNRIELLTWQASLPIKASLKLSKKKIGRFQSQKRVDFLQKPMRREVPQPRFYDAHQKWWN